MKKQAKFWDNGEFLDLLSAFNVSRNNTIMDEIVERFFFPLASRYIDKLTMHPSIDKHELAMEAVAHCWKGLDWFDPAKKNPMAYFVEVINTYAWHCNRREIKRAARFLQLDEDTDQDDN